MGLKEGTASPGVCKGDKQLDSRSKRKNSAFRLKEKEAIRWEKKKRKGHRSGRRV